MEKEFLWGKATEVTVLNKAFAFRAIVILAEMWKSPLMEAKWNSLTLNILLSHTRHDL